MRKFRRVNFTGRCGYCEKLTRHRLLEIKKTTEKIAVLRCQQCERLNLIPTVRVLKSGRFLTPDEFDRREQALSMTVDYTPKGLYWTGQKIRHHEFQEIGKIVGKDKTKGNHRVIIVNFKKHGKKKLLEGASYD